MTDRIWHAKLAAWVHDPSEKALVLGRRPGGHEAGTVRALRELIPDAAEWRTKVERADHLASAADRAAFPRLPDDPYARVDFSKRPVIVHPLSGETYDLGALDGVEPAVVEAFSLEGISNLIAYRDGEIDHRRTFLQFWRFAPELGGEMQGLWSVLPADTRVPDHSIWDHLRLTSAFAGALAEGSPALLAVSLGPVQSFIEKSRTTSDLWAGSHLLARLSLEAIKAVAMRYGPDAILFPDLFGVPLVDLWLATEHGLDFDSIAPSRPEWRTRKTDANPLFAATLPNRFVAVVPENAVQSLAAEIEERTRAFALDLGRRSWTEIARVAGADASIGLSQIEAQLSGFPEVHFASVPFSLVTEDASGSVQTERLESALRPFTQEGGFLSSHAWRTLRGGVTSKGRASFFRPNPGVLYPALYDLLERVLASSKTLRPFAGSAAEGYRCSLCGEREWLTDDRAQLSKYGDAPLWSRIAEQRRAWARPGERLCGLCTCKRLWPTLFVRELESSGILEQGLERYVISTHAMALSSTLERLLDPECTDATAVRALGSAIPLADRQWAALPQRLAVAAEHADDERRRLVHNLPGAFDAARDARRTARSDGGRDVASAAPDGGDLPSLSRALRSALGDGTPVESYYALLLADGDHMGAWLSGAKPCQRLAYEDVWHPDLRARVAEHYSTDADLERFAKLGAPVSPAYHAAISKALNGFSRNTARLIVEELHLGKVLYAGGDDLLAMLAVGDVLSAMALVRAVYQGELPAAASRTEDARSILGRVNAQRTIQIRRGHVRVGRHLLRAMGRRATISMGAVVAHHMAPLGAVLRELRRAEKRAKVEGGRDAFSITVLKRSGGAEHLTLGFGLTAGASQQPEHDLESSITPLDVLFRLRNALGGDLSRRAAYHTLAWLPSLPDRETSVLDNSALARLYEDALRYQMLRQIKSGVAGDDAVRDRIKLLAKDLVTMAMHSRRRAPEILAETFAVTEFLARAGRIEASR